MSTLPPSPRPGSRWATSRVPMGGRFLSVAMIVVAVLGVAACGSDDSTTIDQPGAPTESEPESGGDATEMFPDVVDVEITAVGDGEFEVATTVSSPYDSPERYADAWRVLDADGNELGVRELAHDHADEQPFTREETVSIPDDVEEITVEGRDQVSGYGGEVVTVPVPSEGS